MIAPVRNAYAQRVAGSRIAAGARNVAKTTDAPVIETLSETKRTGAQEESLLREGADRPENIDSAEVENPGQRATEELPLSALVGQSLRFDEKLRAAIEAYQHTLDTIDQANERHKPGDVYDAPL